MTALAAASPVEQPGPAQGAASGGPGAPARRGHLDAVDVIRVVMVLGVISVHVVGYTTSPTDALAAGVSDLLHMNREVFFALTAFVLTYAYGGRRGWSVRKFWSKRYLLVVVPYVAWTVIYFFADHSEDRAWTAALHKFVSDLLTGGARYHLYFLLVTMQIYAIFPLLLLVLKATRRRPWLLLGISLAFQTALTTVAHYRLPYPHFLSFWLNHLDPLVISYPFYVIGGGVAAMHFDEVTAWVRSHTGLVRWLVAGGLMTGLASFFIDHLAVGMDPAQAAEVFQPTVAVTATAVIVGLYALGLLWAAKGPTRPFQRPVKLASDASFGIYLSHPLVLQGLLVLLAPLALAASGGRIPAPLVLAVDFLVVVPLIMLVCAALTRVLRPTPASLPMTGRPRLRPPPPPGPGSGPADPLPGLSGSGPAGGLAIPARPTCGTPEPGGAD